MEAVAVVHKHRWFGEAEMTGELACADCGKAISQYEREYDEMAAFVGRLAAFGVDEEAEMFASNDEEHDALLEAVCEAQSIEAKL